MKLAFIFLLFISIVAAQPARTIADEFLRGAVPEMALTPADLAGVYVWKEYRTAHNGVTHLIYRQNYQGLEVHNAEWIVNVDRQGRVINAGGNLYAAPGAGVYPPAVLSARAAVNAALAAVNPKLVENYYPFESAIPDSKSVRFRWTAGADIEGRAVWRAVNGVLRPAWAFVIVDEDGVSAYETVVDDVTRAVLAKDALTHFQSAPRGLVFTGASPQPNPTPGARLTSVPATVARVLVPLTGDPVASPGGWVSGSETSGNNTVTGRNPRGINFLPTPETAVAASGDFSFPLELGAQAPGPTNFASAAAVNLFYWVNRSHDLFHAIGFDEAAGNFQQDNFNRGGRGGDRMFAYTQFGHAAPVSAALSNAFYTARTSADGSMPMIAMYLGSAEGFLTDGSYDNEVIVHEYTHGVTTRLLRGYGSHQTAAMGEAWSDFYSLEFTLPEGTPTDGAHPVAEYFSQDFGTGFRSRAYSTRMDVNPLTFADIGHVSTGPQVHADGEIWVQTLWQARANLIAQFGEREGRRRIRIIVLDALKLSPPAPSYVDMRNALLLADRVSFDGQSQDQLWDAFARRGLGVLAQSSSGGTVHVLASFERPSSTGALRFYEPVYTIGETVRVVLHDANLTGDTAEIHLAASSGDVERLQLRRSGEVFLGSIGTLAATPVTKGDAFVSLIPGDFLSAFYSDANAGGAARQIEIGVPVRPAYFQTTSAPRFQFTGETRLNFRAAFLTSRRYDLPFAFPFYGRSYSTLRIFSNGLLSFDLPVATSCTDLSALTRHTAIAPLWMESRTNGFAQANEDVYVSETADSITFRWAGETDASLPSQPPRPVNFATTLFRNGRIQFHYGSGNQNLVNGIPISGCSVSAPTVGISPGTETYTQTVTTHFAMPSLENAPTVNWIPPFGQNSIPEAVLESPAAGQTVQGVLNVRGVAFDNEVAVARIDVMIDGVWRARAFVNTPRADFCEQRRVTGCPLVGFNLNLDAVALGLAAGEHTIQLRATNANGAFFTFPETPTAFVIQEGQSRLPFGAIEAPANEGEVSGTALVRGWVAANDLRIVAVDVLVDAISFGRAAYGLSRNDICNGLSPRPLDCPAIGFSFALNTRTGIPLSNGTHALQIRVQDETGRLTLIPETPVSIVVNNEANAPPIGVLVSPVHNERLSGIAAIYGHAYDPDGRVTQVQLLVNGEIRDTIPYAKPRPEECAALTNVAACPNIGFEMALDTRRLNNGPNVLGVRLVDDRGAVVIIPGTLRNGINVFIENR